VGPNVKKLASGSFFSQGMMVDYYTGTDPAGYGVVTGAGLAVNEGEDQKIIKIKIINVYHVDFQTPDKLSIFGASHDAIITDNGLAMQGLGKDTFQGGGRGDCVGVRIVMTHHENGLSLAYQGDHGMRRVGRSVPIYLHESLTNYLSQNAEKEKTVLLFEHFLSLKASIFYIYS